MTPIARRVSAGKSSSRWKPWQQLHQRPKNRPRCRLFVGSNWGLTSSFEPLPLHRVWRGIFVFKRATDVLEFSCFGGFTYVVSFETVPDATTNAMPFEVPGIDEFLQVDFDRIAIRTRQFTGILYRHPATLAGEIEKLE